MSDFAAALDRAFGAERVQRDAPLAPLTTFKVGGPADLLLETRSEDEIVRAVKLAHAAGVTVTMLGGGSNVLIADRGVRGLVIRPKGGDVIADRRPSGARRCRRDHQRPGALDDQSRLCRPRGVGGHTGHGRRRHLRQCALEEDQYRRPGRERAAGQARRHAAAGAGRSHGVRATTTAGSSGPARSCCGRHSGSRRAAIRRAARRRTRVAGVPKAAPSRWSRQAPAAFS